MKKVLIALLVIALICVAAVSYRMFVLNKTVVLESNSGIEITFGIATGSDNSQGFKEKLLATSSTDKIRVQKGTYLVEFNGGKNYDTQQKTIVVNSDTKITAPKLNYSQQYLDNQLVRDAPSIQASLNKKNILGNSILKEGKLYGDGAWFAGKLVPSDSSQDTKLVVLHKQNGSWKLVAGPEISLYIGNYPGVPPSVLRDINNR